ncbi:MAG: uracil phosphoribosyltransferase [Flavobacteriaceae bacterium]|nr:uracil phosphoribosyltransferase [Flavobacteriaceae bacterium]
MSLTSVFEGIQYLFDEILFIPFDFLRKLELDNWWAANFLTWIFILILVGAFVYWMKQLKQFDETEDKDVFSHSFLE